MTIRTIKLEDLNEWLRMRLLLWDAHSPDEHLKEMKQILTDPTCTVLVAVLVTSMSWPGNFPKRPGSCCRMNRASSPAKQRMFYCRTWDAQPPC